MGERQRQIALGAGQDQPLGLGEGLADELGDGLGEDVEGAVDEPWPCAACRLASAASARVTASLNLCCAAP